MKHLNLIQSVIRKSLQERIQGWWTLLCDSVGAPKRSKQVAELGSPRQSSTFARDQFGLRARRVACCRSKDASRKSLVANRECYNVCRESGFAGPVAINKKH